MAPKKKAQKVALGDFLADSTLGSWADEMDSLPTAPIARSDDAYRDRGSTRDFGRDRDGMSGFASREELPLPTKPPFMAYLGNLAFDVEDSAVSQFFGAIAVKDIKLIKDRDGKFKGFGYVEFNAVDDLKQALALSGSQMMGRTVRISVAEPKDRTGSGFGGESDDRFAGPWRRDGPLPPLTSSGRSGPMGHSNYGPRGGEEQSGPSAADGNSDWRSNRPVRQPPPDRAAPQNRPPPSFPDPSHPARSDGSWARGSQFQASGPPPGPGGPDMSHPAHAEQYWAKGSKFQPSPSPSAESVQERRGSGMFSSKRGDAPNLPVTGQADDDHDWRAKPRRNLSDRPSPTASASPTPQLARKKLELLPRGSATPESPLASPRPSTPSLNKSNPFGSAKPVDASAREREVEDKLEKERQARAAAVAANKESEREASKSWPNRSNPPDAPSKEADPATPSSPTQAAAEPANAGSSASRREFTSGAGSVRPKFSFAAAASKLTAESSSQEEVKSGKATEENSQSSVPQITQKLDEAQI